MLLDELYSQNFIKFTNSDSQTKNRFNSKIRH